MHANSERAFFGFCIKVDYYLLVAGNKNKSWNCSYMYDVFKPKIKSEKFYSDRGNQQHIGIAQSDIPSNSVVASVKI